MRTNLIRSLTIGIAAVAVASSAQAQVTKSGAGYQFRVNFVKGKVLKYKITNSMPMPNQPKPLTLVMPIQQTVTAVNNGIATISGKIGPMTMNGNPMTDKPAMTTAKVDRMGKVVGEGAGGNSTFTTYPEKPVKVGGTWTATVPLSGMGPGGGTAQATYKFLGLKNVNGKQMAQVEVSLKSNSAQGNVDGKGNGLILVADGLPVKMDIKMNIKSPQSPNQTIVATISVARV